MIAIWDIDVSQSHKKRIWACCVMESVITLEKLRAPLNLPRQLNQSLVFATKGLAEKHFKFISNNQD